ncbi:MAG: site-2 protease family protein [Solirubrobacteraceae bacterium]|nr:site-2 protease family protein [Solirubrobacteraceae bacterium]
MSWILAFLGFTLLVFFHELGHFAAAKWVGMRVEKFSLFFGPPLAKIRRGETEYQIASIPLGGFVKITGMNPEEELEPEVRARSYAGSPVWKRIFVISAGPFVNVLIAFVLLAGIYLVEGRAVPGVAVSAVEPGFGADGTLEENDRLISVTSPAAAGNDGATASVDRTVLVDGKDLTDEQQEQRVVAARDLISTGGCGAAATGKAEGGAPEVARCEDPQPLTIVVERDGERLTKQVTPQYDEELKRYRLGIGFGSPLEPANVVQASTESVTTMWMITRLTVEAMVKVVYDPEARKEVSSVVGGYEATRQSIEIDTVQAIFVLALISLSLAIINLFPFLPLDGGHIFWALVEKARGGRPVATHVLEKASIVGFALVLVLFAIGLTNDIGRIADGTGFGVR